MRAVLQRVTEASCIVDGEVVGAIDRPGLLVLVGVTHDDTVTTAAELAAKTWSVRMLRDEKSCSDIGAPLLVISQFTLYGDARKGRRPTWSAAAPGEISEPLYRAYCEALEDLGATVARGIFGAMMQISSIADGPSTLMLER